MRVHKQQEINKAIGGVIRELRIRLRISQETLSSLAGLSRTYLGEVERGESSVSLPILQNLAKGLGIKLSDLIRRYERALDE